jgi:hypothetical protein
LTEPESRERAVLDLLDNWPWDLGGVLIGGYAVLAYGPPRYSDDVDVVIPNTAAAQVRGWLLARGFRRERYTIPNPENHEGQVERYRSAEVVLDLLVGAVRDRTAGVDLPEEWISRRARRRALETLSGRTSRPVAIARPEAVWALKLQSGRDMDLADLFAISEEPIDLDEVREIFRRLATLSLCQKLSSVRARLKERKLLEDSLCRRGLGSPKIPRNLRKWERFVTMVDIVILPLLNGTVPKQRD